MNAALATILVSATSIAAGWRASSHGERKWRAGFVALTLGVATGVLAWLEVQQELSAPNVTRVDRRRMVANVAAESVYTALMTAVAVVPTLMASAGVLRKRVR